jgi:hypothetical protein
MGHWWNYSDMNKPENSEINLSYCHNVHIDWNWTELGSPRWDFDEWKPACSGRADLCNTTVWCVTFKITLRFVKVLTILSTHHSCFYLCTISRAQRSLQYRRCCTIRQCVRSEPALRLWCAALLSTRPFSYQLLTCIARSAPRLWSVKRQTKGYVNSVDFKIGGKS